jgi:hypothetical protein
MFDMAVSHCRPFIANLVPDTRSAEAFPGDVSMSAGGCAACEWFYGLDYGPDCFNLSIPQSEAIPSSITMRDCGDLYCRERYGGMVVSQRY